MRLFPKLLLLLVVSLICFAIVEAAYRFLYPEIKDDNFFQEDAVLGHSLIPNLSRQSCFVDFCYTVTTNALGLRNREIPPGKPENTVRILVLGDSFTFGVGADDNETIPARLEEHLNQNARELSYEVINAGISTYGTRQELTYFLDRGYLLQPDIVVMLFFTNDFIDSLDLIQHQVNPDGYLIGKEFKSNQRLLDYNFIKMPQPFHLRLFLAKNFQSVFFFKERLKDIVRFLWKGPRTAIPGGFREAYYADTIENTFLYLKESKRVLAEQSITFVLVNIPAKYDIASKTSKKSILEDFSREQNITFYDGLSAFVDYPADELYWRHDDHTNVLGNDILARFISERLINADGVQEPQQEMSVVYGANNAR